jgi:hypothetical protein
MAEVDLALLERVGGTAARVVVLATAAGLEAPSSAALTGFLYRRISWERAGPNFWTQRRIVRSLTSMPWSARTAALRSPAAPSCR